MCGQAASIMNTRIVYDSIRKLASNDRSIFCVLRITCMHLPVKSKWLYVGSERGNIHIVNVESFVLSGYVINWNKAIDV